MTKRRFILDSFFYLPAYHLNLHFSLHDALPISDAERSPQSPRARRRGCRRHRRGRRRGERSEEHTSELQSQSNIVCRLLLEKKKIATAGSPFVIVNSTTANVDISSLAACCYPLR